MGGEARTKRKQKREQTATPHVALLRRPGRPLLGEFHRNQNKKRNRKMCSLITIASMLHGYNHNHNNKSYFRSSIEDSTHIFKNS
jgi:hypothetical protein